MLSNIQVYPSEMVTHFKICANLDECLTRLDGNPRLAVAISYEQALNSRLIPVSHFYCFEKSEIIQEYALKFLVRKNSTISTQLNKFLQNAIEKGLISKWRMDNQIRSINFNFVQMRLESMRGLFIVWCIVVTSVICLFVLERIVYRKVRTPKTCRYWKYIEIAIDNERQFLINDKRIFK